MGVGGGTAALYLSRAILWMPYVGVDSFSRISPRRCTAPGFALYLFSCAAAPSTRDAICLYVCVRTRVEGVSMSM